MKTIKFPEWWRANKDAAIEGDRMNSQRAQGNVGMLHLESKGISINLPPVREEGRAHIVASLRAVKYGLSRLHQHPIQVRNFIHSSPSSVLAQTG